MKKNWIISIRLSLAILLICSVLYPLLIWGIGLLTPGKGNGKKVIVNGRVAGYELIGQSFTRDDYFQGRPSAAGYNAAASGGSNKGPSNPDYLATIQQRIDSFLVHNPGVSRSQIPADLVTASASGLDPDISPAAALIQVQRVALARKIDSDTIRQLVLRHIDKTWMGWAPEKVNVLLLNCELDELTNNWAKRRALQQSRLAPARQP